MDHWPKTIGKILPPPQEKEPKVYAYQSAKFLSPIALNFDIVPQF